MGQFECRAQKRESAEGDDAFPYTLAGVGVGDEGMITKIFALAGAIAALFGGVPGTRQETLRQAPVIPPLYLAPTGSDQNPCSLSAPCATMIRGFRLAKAGQRVLLEPGDYGVQSLDQAVARTGAPVVFEPAQGLPTLRSLSIHDASNLTIKGLAVDGGQILVENQHPGRDGSTNVTLENVSARTLRLVGQVSGIVIRGGSYGPAVDGQPQIKKYNPGDPDSAAPSHIVVDGASFHDFRRSGNGVHTECLQILSGSQITIRNSRFWNCDGTGDIGITPLSVIIDLTLENNFIAGGGDTGFGVQIGMLLRNFVFRYNTASQPVFFSDTRVTGPYTFVGNYMRGNRSLCQGAASFQNNVVVGAPCGATDVSVPSFRLVDQANHDLHLAPGSEAAGRGSSVDRPRLDIDGDVRPNRFRSDAGADQRETAALVPGRSIGEITLGADEASVKSFYGPGRSSTVRLGVRKVKQITYRIHRGFLRAYVDKGIVVGVATSSGYYTTASGLSPGLSAPKSALRGFKWVPCLGAYSRPFANARMHLAPAAGKRGRVIRVISVLKSPYARCR